MIRKGMGFIRYLPTSSHCIASGKIPLVQYCKKNTIFVRVTRLKKKIVNMSFCETVQGRRPSAVSTVQKHLRGRIIWLTTSGSTRVSHRTSASIAPNPSRGRNIWPITCVNIQANRHTDATSARNHLLVRSTWRIMLESTQANHRTGVNFVRGRSQGKNI